MIPKHSANYTPKGQIAGVEIQPVLAITIGRRKSMSKDNRVNSHLYEICLAFFKVHPEQSGIKIVKKSKILQHITVC